jgi:hypothetical protein
VRRAKSGRTVTVRPPSQPAREAVEWLGRYELFWSESFDRLTMHTERREKARASSEDDESKAGAPD